MSNTTQMRCPACGYAYSKATNTVRARDESVRRQRVCLKCEANFITYEITADDHAILAALRKWRGGEGQHP